MNIQAISITHKNTPLDIREKFSFTKEQQEEIMRKLKEVEGIDESCIISTCNRTEAYVKASDESSGNVFSEMEDILLREADARDDDKVSDFLMFFPTRKAIRHLFNVTAGLDSMLIGEDQILGQVKDAHRQARETGTVGTYLNTLFRDAVTAAKKVKTDTDLSKSGTSTATLAVRAAEEALGSLKNKKVLLIGATGEIGSIVLMNLQSFDGIDIKCTTRTNKIIPTKHGRNNYTTVDYMDRYDFIDEADVVISATSSPHYTLTYSKIKKSIHTEKPRAFIDLAVPIDIEARVKEMPQTYYSNIDDFNHLAKEKNAKKHNSVLQASNIIEEYELKFEQWMIFQENLGVMKAVKEAMMKRARIKGTENAINHLFWWTRDNNMPRNLEKFFECLDHEIHQVIK